MWVFLNLIILLIVNRTLAELSFALKLWTIFQISFNLLLTSLAHFNSSFLALFYSLLSPLLFSPFLHCHRNKYKQHCFRLLRRSSWSPFPCGGHPVTEHWYLPLPLKSLTLGANGCSQREATSAVLETLGRGLEEIWSLETDRKAAMKASELAVKPGDKF